MDMELIIRLNRRRPPSPCAAVAFASKPQEAQAFVAAQSNYYAPAQAQQPYMFECSSSAMPSFKYVIIFNMPNGELGKF